MARSAKGKQPNFLIHLGRRHRSVEPQHLHQGPDGLRTPNIDRIAERRHPLHRLLRRAELHGGPGLVHHRPMRAAHRPDEGRPSRRGARHAGRGPITVAELLKQLGYATGQFGKNHFGDRDEHLPTMHGFDEFFGNLYHLNAEEEPEDARLPDRQGLPRTSRRSSARAACCTAGPTARAARRSRTPAR